MSPTIVVIFLALGFNFLNGIHESSNIVATMISSRAFSPRAAMTMTFMAEFCGPLLFGVAVANTIGQDIVIGNAISPKVLLAGLVSAIFV
jgi:inorganic phosphate transporter, PiT family